MKSLLAAFVALALAFTSTASMAASPADAGKYIESIGSQTITIISNPKLDKAGKQARLEGIFAANVDIPWVGKFVMGRFWKIATEDQKKRYLNEYQSFLLTHYAGRFSEYSSGSFKITGTHEDSENEYTVNMEMQAQEANGAPILVDYRVRKGNGGFKVFDVIIEGVSLITTQRSEFSALLNNKGIDYLIEQLANKSLMPPK
jgi:phospholipid transport system substrate-binding protein